MNASVSNTIVPQQVGQRLLPCAGAAITASRQTLFQESDESRALELDMSWSPAPFTPCGDASGYSECSASNQSLFHSGAFGKVISVLLKWCQC